MYKHYCETNRSFVLLNPKRIKIYLLLFFFFSPVKCKSIDEEFIKKKNTMERWGQRLPRTPLRYAIVSSY